MGLDAAVILLATLVAAVINAAFATGGIYLLIAVVTALLPLSEAIPLMPLLAAGSLIGRCWYFWRDIDWQRTLTFAGGAVLGAVAGANVFFVLPERMVGTLLAISLLVLIWFPSTGWRVRLPRPMFFVGIGHTFISAIVGAGGLLQSILIRSPLNRSAVTATLASCTCIMELFKVPSYALAGFSYRPYLALVTLATLAGLIGTVVGGHIAARTSERYFRPIFKGIISLVAIRLLWATWT
ncbi:MAG: sulfite exporter TauE/SafE family protein [Gammaproteobacteria bacterium]|nr:sulfite exporter TauE/SafE family protein [Gammaproteobacteria bacterium]